MCRTHLDVRGTFVNTQRRRRVFREHAILHPFNVGNALSIYAARAPGHYVVDPVIELLAGNGHFGVGNGKVIRAGVVEVTGIQMPGQHQLFVIAQTRYTLGLGFGLGQRRQKHAGQNRDDRDNNQ